MWFARFARFAWFANKTDPIINPTKESGEWCSLKVSRRNNMHPMLRKLVIMSFVLPFSIIFAIFRIASHKNNPLLLIITTVVICIE